MMLTRRPFSFACGAATLLAGLALTGRPAAATTTFVSDPTWSVTDTLNTILGGAEYVVLNSAHPALQPLGAVNYGSTAAAGWSADLSSIPGAYWIWAPGITGATPNASLAEYSFSKQFLVSGTPTAGTISVAVDDMATVFVNGSRVGSTGSITDAGTAYQAQSALANFNITPFLVSGENTILVQAQNGPASFAGAVTPPYAVNTAGVVFGGTISSNAAVPESPSGALFALGLLPVGLLLVGRKAKRD